MITVLCAFFMCPAFGSPLCFSFVVNILYPRNHWFRNVSVGTPTTGCKASQRGLLDFNSCQTTLENKKKLFYVYGGVWRSGVCVGVLTQHVVVSLGKTLHPKLILWGLSTLLSM